MNYYIMSVSLTMIIMGIIYCLKDRTNSPESFSLRIPGWNLKKAYLLFIIVQVTMFVMLMLPLRFFPKTLLYILSFNPAISIFFIYFVMVRGNVSKSLLSLGVNYDALLKKAIPVALLLAVLTFFAPRSESSSDSDMKLLILIPLSLASVAEELLFRGVLWGAFCQKLSVPKAALASAVCWSLWHYDATGLNHVKFVLIGLFLSWCFYKSRTILVPIAIHLVVNIVIFIKTF